jgi:hypothetical protein
MEAFNGERFSEKQEEVYEGGRWMKWSTIVVNDGL